MLKLYEYNGFTFQFEEGKQPDGAVEIKQRIVKDKEAKPANRRRTTRTKKAE